MQETRRRHATAMPTEFYPGQTFEADGVKYRVAATDSRERIRLEMISADAAWQEEECHRHLRMMAHFFSQHGTPEEKAVAEKIYAEWPHLRHGLTNEE